MNIDTTLIRRAVENAGGQVKMAKAVGVTQGLVSNWCNGATIASRHFSKIADAGRVSKVKLMESEAANAELRGTNKVPVRRSSITAHP